MFFKALEKPSLADELPILKELKPFSHDTSIQTDGFSGDPPRKSISRQYYVQGSYKDVRQRIEQELPLKPTSVWRDDGDTQYEFGTSGQPYYKILWVSGYQKNKTIVAILEDSPYTWMDKVNAWWAKSKAAK